MNSIRGGSSLKIEIRMALAALGRPTNVNLKGKTLDQLKAMKATLYAEIATATTA